MNRGEFGRVVEQHRPRLRSYLVRLMANPDDADDLVQDTIAKAMESLHSLRDPGALRTWLFKIATRLSIDHLRRRSRWEADAQIDGARHFVNTPQLMVRLHQATEEPGFRYDAREHMAYCFTCVSRSLPNEQQVALILGDVLSMSGREAAKCLEVSESVYRHHLAAGRKTMRDTYEQRCALVHKGGVCYQCKHLRDEVLEDRRGEAPPTIEGEDADARYRTRLRIVQDADLAAGTTANLHDLLLRVLDERQQQRARTA